MILARSAIREALEAGELVISTFTDANLGPNSYDVSLSSILKTYVVTPEEPLDVRKPPVVQTHVISENGFVLEPGVLYIGATNEVATSWKYAPMYEGRSSMGRLGIKSHICAGFGDAGWGYTVNADLSLTCHMPVWVLELEVTHHVRVYPNMRIGQVSFHEILRSPLAHVTEDRYTGKYSKQQGPQESLSWKDKVH